MLKNFRSKSVVAAALAMILLLSACSTAPVNTKGTDSTSSQAVTAQTLEKEEAEPAKEGTRTITTEFGDVEVPANPKRVIVDFLTGDLVALGLIPVGYTLNLEDLPPSYKVYLDNDTSQVVKFGNIEEIMSIEPDLIITPWNDEKSYAEFSKVAPTVYVPYGSMTVDERVSFMGKILNKEAEATKLLESYHAKVEEYKNQLEEAGLYDVTISSASVFGQDMYINGSYYGVGKILYETLGLTPPQIVQTELIDAGKSSLKMVSTEVLDQYLPGDYILYSTSDSIEFTTTEIWKLLPAVKNNKVFSLDYTLTFYTDLLTEQMLMENIVNILIEAAKQVS